MPENAPLFNQIQALSLYWLSSMGQASVAGYWAGYRPSTRAGFGNSATLDQVWQDAGGVYLFLNAVPNGFDFGTFLTDLDKLLPAISPTGDVRFIWLANPADPSGYWQMQLVKALATGSGANIAWHVSLQATFSLGSYALMVQPGAALAQADPATTGYGISLDAAQVAFLSAGGAYQAETGSAWLPLTGPALGAFRATMSLPNGGNPGTGPDDMARLGVQLRYALPSPDDPGSGSVAVVSMPVLQQAGATLTAYLCFDPLNPMVPDRTQIGFFSPDGVGSPPPLMSGLVTTRGHGTTLTPLAAAAPLWSARLTFCASPLFVPQPGTDPYYDYYLAPDGAFSLTTTPQEGIVATEGDTLADRLLLGLSGLEYVGLHATSGTVALFRAGQPAFAPRALAEQNESQGVGPLLSDLATTSYLTLLPPHASEPGLTYFAQPRQAPLFVSTTSLGAGFMDFHEMPAATLPSYTTTLPVPTAMPVGIYTLIDPALADTARLLEQAALAPARRAAVGLPTVTSGDLARQVLPLAITPQGMVAILSADGTQWSGLVLANLPAARQQQITFTGIGPHFLAALQSNELFFVVSNVTTLMDNCTISYQLTPTNLLFLEAAGVPASVVSALDTLLKGMDPPYPVFPTKTAFTTAINATAEPYVPQILPVAGLLKADLGGWTFQLSPHSWRIDDASPTIMIFKYCNRSLAQMVADASTWGWPEAAEDNGRDLRPTQSIIQAIFDDAAAAAQETPYALFWREVVSDPAWNGVLFLNAPVSLAELPGDLQFLSAGIDQTRFYAHHVGFSVTPFDVSSGTITLGQTAAFGLIDYQDPQDLYLTETVPFAFKTLALSARFANGAPAGFSAQVELMVNRLFGAELTKQSPERGNNLILNGNYIQQGGKLTYAFTLQGENVYSVARSALESMELLGLQLQVAQGGTMGQVKIDFILSGNLRFVEIEEFDLFSFGREAAAVVGQEPADGYLRFGNLVVSMTFPLADPTQQAFTVNENRLGFDLTNSLARPQSLAAKFPLHVSGFVVSPNLAEPGDPPQGQRPEDLGYTSVAAPIDQSLLSPTWYGLVFTLDLGTLGELAGSVGLSLTVLAAWATGMTEGDRLVYLGLKLPDARSSGLNLPLQGVMRLAFRSFQFVAGDDEDGGRFYMLRLRRLALSILSWSFPPGNADIFLVGNTNGGGKAALSWYAAYSDLKKPDEAAPGRALATRRLLSGRHVSPPTSEQ
ncbi:MAG TPA: hemagglutinin protein [Chloroflexia bacterium]|nr:hemagglutinin protein [Chloroflexia bacterium]